MYLKLYTPFDLVGLKLYMPFSFIGFYFGLGFGFGLCYLCMKDKAIEANTILNASISLDQQIKQINESKIYMGLQELFYYKHDGLVDMQYIRSLRLESNIKDVIYHRVDTDLYVIAYATY